MQKLHVYDIITLLLTLFYEVKMSSPVKSSPFIGASDYQARPAAETEPDVLVDEAQSVEESQIKEQNPLEDEFDSLMRRYARTLQSVAGTGERGQGYIDSEWKKLVKFTEEHPEFKSRLPQSKQRSYDDSTGGFATGMPTFAADARRRNEECVIQ